MRRSAYPVLVPRFPANWTTSRLRARPGAAADAEAVFAAWSSVPECTRWLSFPRAKAVTETRAFLETVERAWAGDGVHLSWLLHDGEQLVGSIGADPDGTLVEVGYVIAPAYWGRGYATEALARLCTLALAEPTIYRVQAKCDVDNVASARVMEKAGMQREGRLRRHTIFPNASAEPRDVWLYARVVE